MERQIKDCKALCADRGWIVAEVFIDNDVSATSGKRRPEYQRLLRAIESGDIDAVAVWDLDRLTRRPAELESFVSHVRESRCVPARLRGRGSGPRHW